MKKSVKVPPADAAYLRLHYKNQSVPEMAKALKRANTTIYGFMHAMGLQPMKRVIHRDHPFKRSNRSLEKMLLLNRIENGKLKKCSG